jgi:branched-subunit amino acid ABC-type transport system permease component
MNVVRDILLSTLTLGALYAASSVALSLVWGSVGMLNLAHGAIIALGAYGSLLSVQVLGLPWWLGIVAGIVTGALTGAVMHVCLVRWVFGTKDFQVNIIILSMGFSTVVVDLINNLIGPNTARQPFNLDGRIDVGGTGIAYQTILIVIGCAIMVASLQYVVRSTSLGRAIRAVSQEPTAALLNGVPVDRIVLKLMLLSGAVAGASGVLLTAWTTVYPSVGLDPLLKALIICVVGGLGSIPGTLTAAFLLAFLEVFVQYMAGTKWGFPALLITVIAMLLVRPNGLFGTKATVRN